MAQVAGEVGYESEASFNRAFKRAFGLPPARYRTEAKAGRPVPPAALQETPADHVERRRG